MIATLLRIFLDEEDRHGKQPLYMAIVDELRDKGFAGATVLKGIEGFGARRRVSSIRTIEYATNLPVLLEVADEEEKVASILPRLREMISGGLITLERIEILGR